MNCYSFVRLHSLIVAEERSSQLLRCNAFRLQGHDWQESDIVPEALCDRGQTAKTQSIQIAYRGRNEAMQNSESHKRIGWLGRSCIAYLNCLIQITNQLYCLTAYTSSSDRIARMAENCSVQGFQRLAVIVESAREALGSDRASNTIISNSNSS